MNDRSVRADAIPSKVRTVQSPPNRAKPHHSTMARVPMMCTALALALAAHVAQAAPAANAASPRHGGNRSSLVVGAAGGLALEPPAQLRARARKPPAEPPAALVRPRRASSCDSGCDSSCDGGCTFAHMHTAEPSSSLLAMIRNV